MKTKDLIIGESYLDIRMDIVLTYIGPSEYGFIFNDTTDNYHQILKGYVEGYIEPLPRK